MRTKAAMMVAMNGRRVAWAAACLVAAASLAACGTATQDGAPTAPASPTVSASIPDAAASAASASPSAAPATSDTAPHDGASQPADKPADKPDLDPVPATSAPAPSNAAGRAASGMVPASGISLAGKVIALDPGHNGGNSSHTAAINAQVPDGRGGTKACNTVGTSTAAGYAEHAFTWDVAQRTAAILRAQGATVLLTRDSDSGVGPCVDARGTFGQDHGADILVSIHGDGSTNTALKGYFAMVSSPPLNDAQGAPSRALAQGILDALAAQGFDRNPNYKGGMYPRSDMVGLTLAAVPATMLELGEMKNPDEAAVMSSEQGRQRYAQAIADGISTYFAG